MIRHLIVFNSREGATREECLELAERGKQQLSLIPGVIAVSFGSAVLEEAKYQYVFIIDFTDESIIELYKHHPIHVEFADTWFRPFAVDRITTDFKMIEL
jgi:fructose-bisphosphate aldolase class II